jgi:hypothetical protein
MTKFIVGLALILACAPALAQKKMYRCGNVFQERPCEGPKADPAKAAPADPQKQQQEAAAKREEKEKKIREDKCEAYNQELNDVRTRIKTETNASETVKDQLQRRQKEMDQRIARECK